MSTSSQSEVRDVAESKQEALRALLNSVAPDGQMTLPKDADVIKLADKLDELLASKGGLLGAQANIARDDQGRPLNEEGLPIVEIVEPVTNDSIAVPPPSGNIASPSSVSQQAPLSPLPNWALSPTALAARRRERDRILDMLEREEEEELAREASANRAARKDVPAPKAIPEQPRSLDQVVRPRIDVSKLSPPTLAEAPTNISTPSEHTAKTTVGPSTTAATEVLNTGVAHKPKKQKSVSFADPLPPDYSNDRSHEIKLDIDWGDVVPVPFKPHNARRSEPNVMKELVVERQSSQFEVSSDQMGDSDDEDDTIEDEDDVSQDYGSDTEVPVEALRQLQVSDESDNEEAEAAGSVDETDFDEAMLQREIALAYYARRHQIGSDVTSGPLSDSAAMNQMSGGDDESGVRPEIDRSTSHFRRSKLSGDPQTLINSAVQFGKLVDGQLVAGQVADREVEASLDELTGRSGGVDNEDLTEKTIALLMHGEKVSRIESANFPIQSKDAQPQVPASASTSARSGSVVAPQLQPAQKLKTQPKLPNALARSSSGKQEPTQQPSSNRRATGQAFPSMIVESGFGFDPAFQVAPKPKPTAVKSVPPVSETVKERPNAPIPQPVAREGKSRFAQSSGSGGVKPLSSSATPNTVTSPTALRGEAIERVAPVSQTQPPEPTKRISRFRAERAGYL
ncbi:hypothetical protein FRC07_014791 [Ceratobasidium sp. 392]|nr:hypothetical protein FRC07_014791 [Ceratobasidium sp. 392]